MDILTEAHVGEIKWLLAYSDLKNSEISIIYDIAQTMVTKIKSKERYRYVKEKKPINISQEILKLNKENLEKQCLKKVVPSKKLGKFELKLAKAKKKEEKSLLSKNINFKLLDFKTTDYWYLLQAYYLDNKSLLELEKEYNIQKELLWYYLTGKNIGSYSIIFEDFRRNYDLKMESKNNFIKEKRHLARFTGIEYWYMLYAYHLDNKTALELSVINGLDNGTLYNYLIGDNVGEYITLFESFKSLHGLKETRTMLTKSKVLAVLSMHYKEGKSRLEIMRKHGIKSKTTIKDIITGKTHKNIYKEYFINEMKVNKISKTGIIGTLQLENGMTCQVTTEDILVLN